MNTRVCEAPKEGKEDDDKDDENEESKDTTEPVHADAVVTTV